MSDALPTETEIDDEAAAYGSLGIERNVCGTCARKDMKVALFNEGVRLCADCLVELANIVTFRDVP